MALLLLPAANSSSKLSKASTTSAAFKALLLLSSVVFDSFQWWICLTESQNPLRVTNFYFPEFNLLFCGTSQKTKTMFQIFSTGYLNPSLNTWTCFEVHFERMPHNKFVFFSALEKENSSSQGDDETESKLVCCSNLLWQLLDKVTPSARFIANNPCANSNNNRYTAPCSFKRVEKTPKSTLTINFNLSSF